MKRALLGLACCAALLTSCGKPDASGVYVFESNREATLIQLIEDKTGGITGRLEATTLATGGGVNTQEANLDGRASGHDIIFKPTSAWFGGINASGTFSPTSISIIRNGATLTVNRASLDEYQKAVAALRSRGDAEAQQMAVSKARQVSNAQKQTAAAERNGENQRLLAATTELKADTERLAAALDKTPDFGRQASQITEKMERMLQAASSLSGAQKSQLVVAAGQGMVATNQLEVKRGQSVIELRAFADRAAPTATMVQQSCANTRASEFAESCAEAKTSLTRFTAGLKRAAEMFKAYKASIATELAHQNLMMDRVSR